MTKAQEQRLEAWMREVTDLLCYQPSVPMDHKKLLVEALEAFAREQPERHNHVNNGVDDACKKCGKDLRDSIHVRVGEPLNGADQARRRERRAATQRTIK